MTFHQRSEIGCSYLTYVTADENLHDKYNYLIYFYCMIYYNIPFIVTSGGIYLLVVEWLMLVYGRFYNDDRLDDNSNKLKDNKLLDLYLTVHMIHHLFQDRTLFGTLINILKKIFHWNVQKRPCINQIPKKLNFENWQT